MLRLSLEVNHRSVTSIKCNVLGSMRPPGRGAKSLMVGLLFTTDASPISV